MRLTLIASAAMLTGLSPAWAAEGDFPASMEQGVLAAWLKAHSDLDSRSIVSVGGGRVIAVTRRGTAAVSTEVRVTVRTEIVSAEAAAQAGALSETQDLTVDCKGRRAKAGQMWSYARHGLQGGTKTQEGFDWASAAPGTTLGKIVEAACRAPGTPPVAVARSTDPLAAAAFAQPAQGAPPAAVMTAPPPAPVAAQALPDPVAAPPPPPPRLPPPAASSEPEPAPTAVMEAPPPPPPPPPPAKSTLSNMAQIGAAGSEAAAQGLLDAFKAAQPDLMIERPTLIEKTVVEGQTFYRALIGGFADYPGARGFCDKVMAAGGACMVRQR